MGLLTDKINNNLEKRNLNYEHALNREPVPLTADVCISGVTEKKKHFGRRKEGKCLFSWLDLFTLNLIDLRSIMGCPGGLAQACTLAFRAKRELHGKKAIIITSKHS